MIDKINSKSFLTDPLRSTTETPCAVIPKGSLTATPIRRSPKSSPNCRIQYLQHYLFIPKTFPVSSIYKTINSKPSNIELLLHYFQTKLLFRPRLPRKNGSKPPDPDSLTKPGHLNPSIAQFS